MRVTVRVENLKVYSFHGCMKEEAVVGGEYVISAEAYYEADKSVFGGELSKTVDYVDLAKIIKREMAIRSKLLESVAKRITSSCIKELRVLEGITVSISKLGPPINADVGSVTVSLTEKRND